MTASLAKTVLKRIPGKYMKDIFEHFAQDIK